MDVFWHQFGDIESIADACAGAIADIIRAKLLAVPTPTTGSSAPHWLREQMAWLRGTANRAKREWVVICKNFLDHNEQRMRDPGTAPYFDWVEGARGLLVLCRATAAWRSGPGQNMSPQEPAQMEKLARAHKKYMKAYQLVKARTLSSFPETAHSLSRVV